MARFKPDGLAELRSWTRGNIMEAYEKSQRIKSSSTDPSKPLEGDGIEMGEKGINAEIIKLKMSYIDEYGLLTTEEANDVLKNIFVESLYRRMKELGEYNTAQLNFALDVAANALVLDYDKYVGLNPKRAIRAMVDLWDMPDAEDLRDEIEDGFDDLSPISKLVVERYKIVAMGSGGIYNYFKELK